MIPFWDDAPGAWETLSLGGVTLPGLAFVSGRVARKMDTRSRAGADGATVRDRGYEPAQIEIHVKVWTAEQLEQLEQILATIHPRNVVQPTTPNQARAERDLERARQREAATRTGPFAGAVGETAGDSLGASASAGAAVGDAFAGASATAALEAQVATERARPRARATRTPLDIAHPATELLGIRRVYVTGISVPELQGGEFVTTISALEWTEAPRTAPPPAANSAGGSFADGNDAFTRHQAAQRPTAAPPSRVRGPGS